jgi:hypothetical protein
MLGIRTVNKIRSKLLDLCSVPFCGRKHSLSFQGNFRLNHFFKTRQPKIKKSQKNGFEVQTNHYVKLFWLFCKTIFCVIPSHSIQSFGIRMHSFFCGITETFPTLATTVPYNECVRFNSISSISKVRMSV